MNVIFNENYSNEIDPSENREEFESRLKDTFNWKNFCTDDPMTCLLTNDTEKLDAMRACMSSCTSRINYYLTEWDNAQTPEAKQAVVGSVQGTIG